MLIITWRKTPILLGKKKLSLEEGGGGGGGGGKVSVSPGEFLYLLRQGLAQIVKNKKEKGVST